MCQPERERVGATRTTIRSSYLRRRLGLRGAIRQVSQPSIGPREDWALGPQ
jgi:hypothetical protein